MASNCVNVALIGAGLISLVVLLVLIGKNISEYDGGSGTAALMNVPHRRKNVLFLIADDLRPQFGPYMDTTSADPVHPVMHTPNLNSLASRSLVLKRAYVQQSLCAPSRTSMLTARRPDTTHTHDLWTYWRESAGNFTTLPQYLKENGYRTAGVGKVFHEGHVSGGDDPISWTDPYFRADDNEYWSRYKETTWHMADDKDVEDHPLEDMMIASQAVRKMNELAQSSKPFFLGVGFHRPHLPFLTPAKFYDHYPKKSIKMPPNYFTPEKMPEIAWSNSRELRSFTDIPTAQPFWYGAINDTLHEQPALDLRRAYYASVSYIDSLVGEVVDNLEKLGLLDDTIIVFLGDHGWHLGDNAIWAKATNLEAGVRAPLMLTIPGLTDNGVESDQLVEFIDLFPTLAEVLGFPAIPICPEVSSHVELCAEGTSFLPIISNPNKSWKKAVFSQYPRFVFSGEIRMGYTVRTERYRYTEWVPTVECEYRPRWGEGDKQDVELYDHAIDLQENRNVASLPEYQQEVVRLHHVLRDGWRHVIPAG